MIDKMSIYLRPVGYGTEKVHCHLLRVVKCQAW